MNKPDAKTVDDLAGDLLDIIAKCRPEAAESLNGMVHDDINTDLLMQKLIIYICERDTRVLEHGVGLGKGARSRE